MPKKPGLTPAQHRIVAQLLRRQRTQLSELYQASLDVYAKESKWLSRIQQARKYLDELYALGEAELYSKHNLREMPASEREELFQVYDRSPDTTTQAFFRTDWQEATAEAVTA